MTKMEYYCTTKIYAVDKILLPWKAIINILSFKRKLIQYKTIFAFF